MIIPYLVALSLAPPPTAVRIFQLCLFATLGLFISALPKRIRLLRRRRNGDLVRNGNTLRYHIYAWVQGCLLAVMAICTPTVFDYMVRIDRIFRFAGYRDPLSPEGSVVVVALPMVSFFALGLASLAIWIDLVRNSAGRASDSQSGIPVTAPGA